MTEKTRLDAQLCALNLAESREKAHALVLSGTVYVNGRKADKPSLAVSAADVLEVRANTLPFVSRGGLKLQKALRVFPIDVKDLVAVDVGASTGGFTDCLLQHGARRVFAIDVGYGQLDWRLRQDPRVTVRERTNARQMQPDWFDEPPAFACMDVSFISIRLIFPALKACLVEGAHIVALIKPQFEAGRDKVGKKGVVRDSDVHAQVICDILAFCRTSGFAVRGLDFSPITGPEGNIEFLLHLRTSGESAFSAEEDETRAKDTAIAAKTFHKAEK